MHRPELCGYRESGPDQQAEPPPGPAAATRDIERLRAVLLHAVFADAVQRHNRMGRHPKAKQGRDCNNGFVAARDQEKRDSVPLY